VPSKEAAQKVSKIEKSPSISITLSFIPLFYHCLLAIPDSWAREGVALRVIPLIKGDTSVVCLVGAGEFDSGAKLSGSARLDLKLEALDVELRLADVTLVEANVLNADEVLASGDVVLDGPLEPVLLPVGPGCVNTGSAGVVEAALHDLDPVAGSVVALDGAGSLGDVDEAWAWVLDELVVEELEAKLVTSLDGVGGSVAGSGALVAAEVVAVHQLAGEGWHVRVAVLASVGIVATDGLSVDNQTVEDVMGVGTEGRKQREESNCLDHFEVGEECGLKRSEWKMK
jgi:hypothetical protein